MTEHEPTTSNTTTEPYNMSLDAHYESKRKQVRLRHGVGKIVLRHSLPAVRLEYPYYKTFLTREEARSLHRPQLTFPKAISLPVLPPRPVDAKAMKRMEKKGEYAITSQKELSLKDECSYFLLEYSVRPIRLFWSCSTHRSAFRRSSRR